MWQTIHDVKMIKVSTDLAAMGEEARLLAIATLQRRHLITVPAPDRSTQE